MSTRRLSFPVSFDVPEHVNEKFRPELREPNFAQAYGDFGIRTFVRASPPLVSPPPCTDQRHMARPRAHARRG
jgi:hypothetical protein